MISRLHGFFGIFLIAYPLATMAGQQVDSEDIRSIETQLRTSVRGGMTIDEAVSEGVMVAPHNGGIITRAALNMYRELPTACAVRAKDGGMRLSVWPDFKACSNRIVRAAIEAGADPTEVTAASAAGMPEAGPGSQSASDQSARKSFGIDLYVIRKILLGSAY